MDTAHLLLRTQVRMEIEGCQKCQLHKSASPVPFDGLSPNEVMVLGEAPGRTENEEGKPFVGASGQLLRSMLVDAGFKVEELTFANAVCCFPDRTPTSAEMAACQSNLQRQLEVVDPRYIIAVGGIALGALAKTVPRMGDARGRWFRPSTLRTNGGAAPTWCIATFHPAAVLRNQSLKEKVEEDLLYARLVIQHTMAFDLTTPSFFCVRCGEYEVEYVDDFPYCKVHMPKVEKRKK